MISSRDDKIEILTECFNTLVRYPNNSESLAEIIGKVSVLDVDLARYMWEFLLQENNKAQESTNTNESPLAISSSDAEYPDEAKLKSTPTSEDILGSIWNYSFQKYHFEINHYELISEVVLKSYAVTQSVYKTCPKICSHAIGIIRNALQKDDFQTANEMILLIKNNTLCEESFGASLYRILHEVFDFVLDIRDDLIDFSIYWMSILDEGESRAQIKAIIRDQVERSNRTRSCRKMPKYNLSQSQLWNNTSNEASRH